MSTQPTMTKEEQDDLLMKQTQDKRLLIVDEIFKEGVPHDNELLNTALKALDGIDKQIQTNRKINNENKSAQSQEQIAAIMAVIASNTSVVSNPTHQTINRPIPEVPVQELIQRELVPGETATGSIEQLDFDSFMPKVEK